MVLEEMVQNEKPAIVVTCLFRVQLQHNTVQSPLLGREEDGASTSCKLAVSRDRVTGV